MSERKKQLARMFAEARAKYPKWSHTSLIDLVWKRRPHGTDINEVLKIAQRFRLPVF
jgi:hypothetical protein